MTRFPKRLCATFLHPSMGLGGAERLILQSSASLRKIGWQTRILTAAYDSTRAFAEAEDEAIRVVADTIPASVCGRMKAWCSYLRMRKAATALRQMHPPDLIVVDLVPHVVPKVKRAFPNIPVLVYCHYPDQLLVPGGSRWYRWYRRAFDQREERGLKLADRILVNSEFTKRKLVETYASLDRSRVRVLRPGVAVDPGGELPSWEARTAVLSLARIHPSKNLQLSLRSFAQAGLPSEARLVIAGGLDPRDRVCMQEKAELQALADGLALKDRVEWVFNPSDEKVQSLWREARVLMYPPKEEHFGIVPAEAMVRGVPVVAVDAGGPVEVVQTGSTGFLCEPTPSSFASAVRKLWSEPDRWNSFSNAGRIHAARELNLERFETGFQSEAKKLIEADER